MAGNAPDEGRGASITLGTSTWETSTFITAITPDPITRTPLDTSALNTVNYRTFIAEDLADPGGCTVEFFHNGDAEPPITTTVPETLTITFPVQAVSTNGASISASAFCVEYTPGSTTVGELIKGSAKFKFSGIITFTDAS